MARNIHRWYPSRHRCGLLIALVAPWTIACNGPGVGSGPEGPLSGTISGRVFVALHGLARTLPNTSGIAVDWYDYEVGCTDTLSGVQEGSRSVSIVVGGYGGPNTYVVGANPLASDVNASVSTWEYDVALGRLLPRSLILNSGSLQVVTDRSSSISGVVTELTTAAGTGDTRLEGEFTADFCAPPTL